MEANDTPKNQAAQAMRALVKPENCKRTPAQCRKGALAAAKAKREKRKANKDTSQAVV